MPWSMGFILNRLQVGLGPRKTLARECTGVILKDCRSNVGTDVEESSTRVQRASHVMNDKGSLVSEDREGQKKGPSGIPTEDLRGSLSLHVCAV